MTDAPTPEDYGFNPRDVLVITLRGLAFRMQCRVERIEERDGENAVTGPGVGISYLFAKDIARALTRAAEVLDPDAPASGESG